MQNESQVLSKSKEQMQYSKPTYPFGMSFQEWSEYSEILDEVRKEHGSVRNAVLKKIEEHKKLVVT